MDIFCFFKLLFNIFLKYYFHFYFFIIYYYLFFIFIYLFLFIYDYLFNQNIIIYTEWLFEGDWFFFQAVGLIISF